MNGIVGRLSRLSITAAFAIAALTPGVASAQQAPAGAAAQAAASPGPLIFQPVEDGYVRADQPTSNFGNSVRYTVEALPLRQAFIKFDVSGLSTPVATARLRLHVRDVENAESPDGGTVFSVDTGWTEDALTFLNRPALGRPLVTLGAVNRNEWYEVDVTSAVTGNNVVAMALSSGSSNMAIYDSREAGAALAPQLVVTVEEPAVLVGAGDISSCGSAGDKKTAALLDTIDGTVFTAGDNAYPDGSADNYANCYEPTWGRHKARTRPAPGNHEYKTAGASGYFGYFGAAAGDPARGYYSYDLGDWHVVVVNSNCTQIGGCQVGSPQEIWLRADLAASSKSCTIAIWHHPLFISGTTHSPATQMQPIYRALYDMNAEVVISGHSHNYERFAPQDPEGNLDLVRGIRQFVVGTGGVTHHGFTTAAPNSEARNADTYGVLKLTLRSGGYDFQFVPEADRDYSDSGSGSCH